MSNPKIRLAQPSDERPIHEAHMRSIREVCVKDHGEEEVRGWGHRPLNNRWRSGIEQKSVWVVEGNNQILGFGHIRLAEENGKKVGHLHALYLVPEILGQGFGRQLMEQMILKAKKFGAEEIRLESTITAHNFYSNFGFRDSAPMMKVEIGGHPVTCYPMALALI